MPQYFADLDYLRQLAAELDPAQLGVGVLLGSSAALLVGRSRHRSRLDQSNIRPDVEYEVVLLDHFETEWPMNPKAAERALAQIVHQHLTKIAQLFEIMHADIPQARASAKVFGGLFTKEDPLTVVFDFGGERITYRASVADIVHGSLWARLSLIADKDNLNAFPSWAMLILTIHMLVQSPVQGVTFEPNTYVCYLDATGKNTSKQAEVTSIVQALVIDGPQDRDSIAKVQYCLTQAGYDAGPVDGKIGPLFRQGTAKVVEVLETRRDMDAETLWRSESFVRMFIEHTIEQYEARLDQALASNPDFAPLKRSRR